MATKKGDFIEIDYTGSTEGIVFDTTNEEVAKKQGLDLQKNITFKPQIIVLGENHILPGLDRALTGKELGKYTINLQPEDAFGKKDAKLLKLIPLKVFKAQNIRPFPGLQVNMDGTTGTVRNVSGGRIIVDYNHPLSSKEIKYEVELLRIVDDLHEKTKTILNMMQFPYEKIEADKDIVKIISKNELPAQITEPFSKDLIRLLGVKEVKFEVIGKPSPAKTEKKKEAVKVEETKTETAK